jgi:hypothetical protein
MNEIICPNCESHFKIDETEYSSIVKQVRDQEFNDQLDLQIKIAEREKTSSIALVKSEVDIQMQSAIASKEFEIQSLKNRLKTLEIEQEIKIVKAVTIVEKERDAIQNCLNQTQTEKQLAEVAIKDKYETQIKDRDNAIERLRDLKARLSTKMIGETLEQHCDAEFNRIRASAFPRAYFEKDNDARLGSKGDFIFRDTDELGSEIVSIMFEMKNECDTTVTKKKNEDFLKELDKDRREKGCEYAVLVSLLEPSSELYNVGIVDMLHRFPKMYVVRPQFFVPIITLLRNAAMKSIEYRAELALIKAQHIDITNFENDLDSFKTSFEKNFGLAATKFQKAIDEIDKSIDHLQKTKDALIGTNRNLRLANNKAQDITIKKLVRGNTTMAEKFNRINS